MKAGMRLAIPVVALILFVACGDDAGPAGEAPSPTSPAGTQTEELLTVAEHFRAALTALEAGDLESAAGHTEEAHELAHDEGLDEAAEHGDEALEALEAGNADEARKHMKLALKASRS